MITLSNDASVKLPTTGMGEGYVITKVYKENFNSSTLVFTGHSYVSPANSSLYINLNDIAGQNRNRYDYLKLNDNGEVVSNAAQTFGTLSSRFEQGQKSRFIVTVSKDSSTYSAPRSVVTAYEYVNKDIEPTIVKGGSSFMGRMTQGADWFYDPDEPEAVFNNMLLPHYPEVLTRKYGMGLQIHDDDNRRYALKGETGLNQKDLGYSIIVPEHANMTFFSLYDIIRKTQQTGYITVNSDKDTSIYLKLYGSDNDVFGHYEGHTEYQGRVFIQSFTIRGFDGTQWIDIERSQFGDPDFNDEYLPKYMTYSPDASVLWDYDQIVDGDPELYSSFYLESQTLAERTIENYENQFEPVIVEPWTSDQRKEGYENIMIRPNFTDSIVTRSVNDYYAGNCPVAIIDHCYERYYLAWMDRYGDVQSQSFGGKSEFSESLEADEVKDFKMRRRISHKTVQNKWKLNTKWIHEDIYPIYESIFTSPYLLLYDTQTDRSWNVILTNNNYVEKTFKNEKKLFNMGIEVEENKKQNNIF